MAGEPAAVDRRLDPDLVILAKLGNRRFAKFIAKLEHGEFYGRVTIRMERGEVVGVIETGQTYKIDDNT